MNGTVAAEQLVELRERLESLNRNCLTDLLGGLDAMQGGDLTVEVVPRTRPLELSGDPDVDGLIEVFNRMLERAQRGLRGYNVVREDLRSKLGDRSVISDLDDKMRSLDQNCLVSLGNGLTAITQGRLDFDAFPVTTHIDNGDGHAIGSLGETFNSMLSKAQAGLELYNTSRRSLQAVACDLSTGLSGLQAALGSIANGDLTTALEAEFPAAADGTARGVFADMLSDASAAVDSFERTRDGLTRLVAELQGSASTVSAASEEMAATSEQTGRAIEEIASAIDEVATGAERQVQMVTEAREAAERTAAEADAAKAVANDGVRSAEDAGAAMQAVSDSTRSVSEAINGLATRSEEIGGIVETITKIASQTNLLALNAAIEAARAGDQGRGFAVVADEVRKLAEESKTAASKISELIAEIQVETRRTVAIAEDGAERTSDGVKTVKQAQEAFGQIGDQVDRVTSLVGEIVTTTNEVAAVAEQSSASAQQVSTSTQETSASSEEVSASAQELAVTAQQLETLAGTFKIAV